MYNDLKLKKGMVIVHNSLSSMVVTERCEEGPFPALLLAKMLQLYSVEDRKPDIADNLYVANLADIQGKVSATVGEYERL